MASSDDELTLDPETSKGESRKGSVRNDVPSPKRYQLGSRGERSKDPRLSMDQHCVAGMYKVGYPKIILILLGEGGR